MLCDIFGILQICIISNVNNSVNIRSRTKATCSHKEASMATCTRIHERNKGDTSTKYVNLIPYLAHKWPVAMHEVAIRLLYEFSTHHILGNQKLKTQDRLQPCQLWITSTTTVSETYGSDYSVIPIQYWEQSEVYSQVPLNGTCYFQIQEIYCYKLIVTGRKKRTGIVARNKQILCTYMFHKSALKSMSF